jgi:hypothetical protein
MEPKADSRNGSCRCLNIRMQLPKNFMRPDREPAKVDPVCASSCLENPITCAQETKPKRACQNGSCGCLSELPVHVPTKLINPREPTKMDPAGAPKNSSSMCPIGHTRESLPKWMLTRAPETTPERDFQNGSCQTISERTCKNGSRRHLREFPVHVPTKLTRGSLPKWILLVPTRIHLTCAQWAAREKACQSGSLHVPPKPHPRSISKMCPAKPYLKELAKMDPMGASTIPGCL